MSGAPPRSWPPQLPGVRVSLSCEVCPEVREYERFSTTCANAYVQPLMARYLESLRSRIAAAGFACPVLLMTSGGGLTTLETAVRFPIRLVESGPAGGVILSTWIAERFGIDRILSRSTWAAPPPRSASSTTASRWPRAASRSTAATAS